MWCCCYADATQLEPLIEDTLMPRLVELARTHKTRYVLHSDNAQRFAMLGDVRESQDAAGKAQQEQHYYNNVVELKRLLEDSRIVLDTTTGLITWNAEVGALLTGMPSDVVTHFAVQ
jgi:hypothetical protein